MYADCDVSEDECKDQSKIVVIYDSDLRIQECWTLMMKTNKVYAFFNEMDRGVHSIGDFNQNRYNNI